uniref:Protein SHQ1 homolog n=1 Tax=Zeugodacus cucurbitae TaxID=28588 RepID=A0A0A1XGD1_ZEUCU
MTFEQTIQHTIDGDVCRLQIALVENRHAEAGDGDGGGKETSTPNRRNCDIFVEDHNFYIYADTRLYRFNLPERQFDTKDMKNFVINFNTKTNSYEVDLPCLPRTNEEQKMLPEKSDAEKKCRDGATPSTIELWKLKRITDNCLLRLDKSVELSKFIADFGYGFAGRFKGDITGVDDRSAIAQMPEPGTVSPLQRSIDREIDELKNFSRDQYKLNFVELQVPEGHENPMKYTYNFEDVTLTRDEECLLHNLTRKSQESLLSCNYEQSDVDCGLICILLAICYDIRTTSNEPTCESPWTRSILTATLSYFEPFENIKDVVISFLRRSLIYPLYRNYDLGRLCLQDAIDGLKKNPAWVLKQLLQTHAIFASSDCQQIFNQYYIEDYIRYVADSNRCGATHLRLLARNLKNVLLDVSKKHLRLELGEIETELLKELITDIHLGNSSTSEDDDTDEDIDDVEGDDANDESGTESGEDATDSSSTTASSSSSSDTEQNSVIEQCKEVVNVAKN